MDKPRNKREWRVWDAVFSSVFATHAIDPMKSWKETASEASEAATKAIVAHREAMEAIDAPP